jgi:transposase
MQHNKIPKSKINTIRSLYLKGRFSLRAASRDLKISTSTVSNYVHEFKEMKRLYPDKLADPRFFLPEIRKLPTPKKERVLILNLLPGLVEADHHKRLVAVNLYHAYKLISPHGYSVSRFKNIYLEWRAENKINVFHNSRVKHLSAEEIRTLERWRHDKVHRNWEKSIVIQGSYAGKSLFDIADRTGLFIGTIEEWVQLFKKRGLAGITQKPSCNTEERTAKVKKKTDDLMRIVHQTPHSFGINRTSWSLETLADTYLKVYGIVISRATVSLYIRSQGFSFKKAREVLTSPDPNFKEKLDKVIDIVANLGKNDKFFSIDELGPFGIKIRGGWSFMKYDDIKTIPAYPKTKAYLICTAALELSTNQVTHFYSPNKSTEEMIKLIKILMLQYSTADKIYLSWDAASWHSSRPLNAYIKDVNSVDYRNQYHSPLVALAPLPISSQFLNVIESVFSGLAKTVLHNSDYETIDVCKHAIDLYFEKRNAHFIANPKRAGNKIWGKEVVEPAFYEAHNCKDPKVR